MSRFGASVPTVVLASGSPRRLDLLRMFGLEPEVILADVDETPLAGEKPAELVERLSRLKAETVWRGLTAEADTDRAGNDGPEPERALVIAADTVIDLDGEIFGKPVDDQDAVRMLSALSGRSHDVVTGMAVVSSTGGIATTEGAVVRAEVWVRRLTTEDIDWYIGTGEPEGKAGAYAIQGLGSVLIDRIEGSYQGVVGLPLRHLDELTTTAGYPLRTLRRS